MKLTLCAVGRLGNTPENTMARDYLSRAAAGGRALGFGGAELVEVEAKNTRSLSSAQLKSAEADAIRAGIGEAIVIACDEHGENLTSRELAARIEKLRDRGERKLAFLIGGADGLDPALVKGAAFTLAFGKLTWPHALARVMLAEQMYRAITILGGSPYHRD